jgi:hypothetical protein
MGLGDGRIPASQITVSSVLREDRVENGADQARLNGLSAWRPVGTKGEYFLVMIYLTNTVILFIIRMIPDRLCGAKNIYRDSDTR